jgi:hypothetical protein
MAKMVVCLFNTHDTADAARQDLLERGFDQTNIRVAGGDEAPASIPNATVAGTETKASKAGATYDAGISGVIERMFSGFLPDEAEVRRYAKEVAGGRSLVVVGELDDSAAEQAAGILARRVTGRHSPCAPPQGPVPDGQTQGDVNRVESSIDLDAMLSGPRVYPLLNSPTGWREASRGAMNSIGGRETDPSRPTGLLDDAGGLDTEDDRSRLSRSSDGTPTR